MTEIAKEITLVNIEEEVKRSYLDYAMSVIISRALPDVRDGLKPVHRRILYAMNMLNNSWDKPYKKSARIVGDVIGKYHPHGDSAVYDAIVRMAQSFSLRYVLVDGQGNFGSVDGDPAAAMRYTEIRLTKIAHLIMEDIEKETIDLIDNYDNTEKIPEIMPTKIPNLLINGSSGIAVGMATNIPPHNIKEVIDGCLAYIVNRDITIKELMKYIPGPDFPTAAIINGCQGIEEAYSTGHGKIYIRARVNLKTDNKTGRETIIINEIPYQVNKARLVEKIAYLVKEKHIEGISALRDESDKDGMRIVIEIKKGAIGNLVLNNLYSQTQLQTSFSINMVALCNKQPKVMNLKEIIESFICHRREIVTRRTIFELNKLRNRAHILEGLTIALANIDDIIKIICCSSSTNIAKTNLISRYWKLNDISIMLNKNNDIQSEIEYSNSSDVYNNNQYQLTDKQAQAILDLRLQSLTNIEYKKLLEEYKEILIKIDQLSYILSDCNHLMKIIYKELELIRDKFGDTRRTTIIGKNIDIKIENLINQKEVIVTLSHKGYVKYQPIADYEAQRRGGKGKSVTRIKEEDFIVSLLVANTHYTILCFSSRGRLYWMKVYQLPESSRWTRGRPIINLLPLEQNERITALLPIRNYEEGINVFMATANGIVKKTALIEFSRPRSTGIIAINLNAGDELIGVDLTSGNDEVMLFSSLGKAVRFKEDTVRTVGRNAVGVRGIKLSDKDKVVSLIIPRNKGSILTLTKNGYGKRTVESQYPIKSRDTQGVISIKVTKRNGSVVSAVQVDDSDQIMIITDTGMLVRINVSEISIVGRNTQGVILIRTAKNENVVGLQRLAEQLDSNA